MYNEVLYLIPMVESTTNLGVHVETEGTPRAVFCSVTSVTMKENFEGITAGFKPVMRAKLSDRLDYQGEKLCKLGNEKYEIYRTYFTDATHGIELYLQKRAGVNGK